MNTNRINTIIIAGLALASAACTNVNGDSATREISFTRNLAAEVYTLDGSAADYGSDKDLNVALQVDILMPEAMYTNDIAVLQDSIRAKAFGDPSGVEAVSNYFDSTARQFGYPVTKVELSAGKRDSLLQSQPELMRYDGSAQVTVNVASMTPEIISFMITSSSYMPRAAHGMYNETYVTYDTGHNKVLTLKDLFTPAGLEALPQLIAARAALNVSSLGQTDISALPSGDNFYMSADGDIVFVYQPYEVASYAQGVIRVSFQPYELNSYLSNFAKALLLNE